MSTYFKRFRMDADLSAPRRPLPLPTGYRFVSWNEALLDVHARTKHRSFRGEIDALVFPCLGNIEGCRRLMREIRNKPGFLPAATWLVVRNDALGELEWCATIQGVVDKLGVGSIQNIGVVPSHRGFGLGTCLIEQALAGFRGKGLRRAFLEVTAENSGAVRLYQRLGFRRTKTIYKVVEASDEVSVCESVTSAVGASLAEPACP
ncbi:MAG: GNAT family N-acetyltransferase [Planctomycetia bacterium]|jgi:N-acetylglutamate synthase-like GNAT family acetyltransferase